MGIGNWVSEIAGSASRYASSGWNSTRKWSGTSGAKALGKHMGAGAGAGALTGAAFGLYNDGVGGAIGGAYGGAWRGAIAGAAAYGGINGLSKGYGWAAGKTMSDANELSRLGASFDTHTKPMMMKANMMANQSKKVSSWAGTKSTMGAISVAGAVGGYVGTRPVNQNRRA